MYKTLHGNENVSGIRVAKSPVKEMGDHAIVHTTFKTERA